MKNLLFFLLFTPAIVFANQGNPNPSLNAITIALSAGDADGLAKYFADNVEISIQDKEQTYNKAKATEVVRSFFGSNQPKSFTQLHKGTSRESSDQYCIGNLVGASGNYRVFIFLKVNGNDLSIEEIRFDKE